MVNRVSHLQNERASVIEAIAAQAQTRAVEVAGWGLQRDWPRRRLAEAWVVARHGAWTAGDSGTSCAGPLSDDMYAKLRRSVARYERNASARPQGWPAGGLAALLHLGTRARDGLIHDPPRTLAYAIGRLGQTATRMRARRTVGDPQHDPRAVLRAARRREPATAVQHPGHRGFCFRLDTGSRWPVWILLPGAKEPTFDADGELMLDPELVELYSPAPTSQSYRLTVRDAYHLAGLTLPQRLDGPATMTGRADGYLPAARRPESESIETLELAELAHHTGQPTRVLKRLPARFAREWLSRLRREDADRALASATAFRAELERVCRSHDDGPSQS